VDPHYLQRKRAVYVNRTCATELPCQQRHKITNCAREHWTKTYLKELSTSQTHIFLRIIHKDTY